jgi:lysozyme
MLGLDLAPVERFVASKVTVEINQSQFDALVSFAFSVGFEQFEHSQVLRRVNAGDFVSAACAMDAWRKSDVSGELEIVGALVRRRAAEKALFLKELPHDASPSVYMRAKLDYAAQVLGAPVKYAAAPPVGSLPVTPAKPVAIERLGDILRAEPATEALLLTQVAPPLDDMGDEIVTGHAKPVARKIPVVEASLPVDRRLRRQKQGVRMPHLPRSAETFGLIVLFVFGLGLVALGASTYFGGTGDIIDIAGASALAAPGLAAALMAAFGIFRGVRTQAAHTIEA